MDSQAIKNELSKYYDNKAKNLDNEEWYDCGNSHRIPEGKTEQYFIDRKVDKAFKLANEIIPANASVLEIGCSFGYMTSRLADKYSAVSAIDISPECIKIASTRFKKYGVDNVYFAVDDAESINHFPNNKFDIVFSFSTLRYCPDPVAVLKAVHAKLKENGIAIIDFPNLYCPWHTFIRDIFKVKRHPHDNLYSKNQIVKIFENANFDVKKVVTFLFTPRFLPSFALPLFKTLDFLVEPISIFSKFSGIIMIKATKQ